MSDKPEAPIYQEPKPVTVNLDGTLKVVKLRKGKKPENVKP